jgi:predicted Zn-dependent peptidase
VNTFEFVAEQITKLTNEDVQRVANEYLNKDDAFTLIYTKA